MKKLIDIFKGSILQNPGDEQSARVTDSGRKVMNFKTEKENITLVFCGIL